MACVTILGPYPARIESVSTVKKFTWLSPWISVIGIDDVNAVLKLAGVANALRGQPCYQLAVSRTDKPSSPVAIGTQMTADGETHFDSTAFGLSGATSGYSYIRFGVATDLSSAPNMGMADATLTLAVKQCGQHYAAWSGHLQTTSTTSQYQAITAWMPALGLSKVQLALVISGLLGPLRVTLTFQTATATPEIPDAWDSTGLGSSYTANGESNTGEQTLTLTGKMWVRLGIRYEVTSAPALGTADMSCIPQGRR